MTTQNYLMIQQNVVTNVCVWDGNTNTWQPPADATMLVQLTTPAMVWEWDKQANPPSWVLKQEIGVGQIGFTWNGSVLTTNEPQPEPPIPSIDQPNSNGTTTI